MNDDSADLRMRHLWTCVVFGLSVSSGGGAAQVANRYTNQDIDSRIESTKGALNSRVDLIEQRISSQSDLTRARVDQAIALMGVQQKQVDWWLSWLSISLAVLSLVAVGAGILIPWISTRLLRREYENARKGAYEAADAARSAAQLALQHADTAGRTVEDILKFSETAKGASENPLGARDLTSLEIASKDPRLTEERRLRARLALFQSLGNWDQAVATARELVQKHPTAREVYVSLGYALQSYARTRASPERRAALEEAKTWYEREISREPESALAHNNLGWILTDLAAEAAPDHGNRLAEAERALKRAIELNQLAPEPWNNLGWIEFSRFNNSRAPEALDRAERHFRHALSISPNYSLPRENIERVETARRLLRNDLAE